MRSSAPVASEPDDFPPEHWYLSDGFNMPISTDSQRREDALQQTFDVCRLDVPVKQPPPRQGGDADDDKDEPQTHHEGAIAPASAAGSRSPVLSLIAVANRLRTKPVNARTVPDRLKAASRRSSAVDLFEASLRQISATATLRSRFGDRSDV